MQNFEPEMFIIVPMGLGVAFMLWVLWNFWKDERRKHVRDQVTANSQLSVVTRRSDSRFLRVESFANRAETPRIRARA
jgi:hypothetical protein